MIQLLTSVLRFSRLPELVRRFTKDRVAVILYHDPPPDIFESHLRYLSRHYEFVSYEQVVSALLNRDWGAIPQNALVIHFDDGYRGNAALIDICARFNVVPTLYLCSHVVATNCRFWSKLKQGKSKHLRLVTNKVLLEKLQEEAGYNPAKAYPTREALSQGELRAMARQFDFQSHGRHHFSAVTMDEIELERELAESRDRVEKLTKNSCNHFSFPYGDYDARELEAVKDAGYITARTTRPGWVSAGSDPHQIPIVADVPGNASVNELSIHLTGIPRSLKRFVYRAITRHIYSLRQRRLMAKRFFQQTD